MMHSDAKGHFLQHSALARGSKQLSKCLIRIWIATISTLWWSRNSVVFDDKLLDVGTMVDTIQHKVWLWMKAKERNFSASFFKWISSPLLCC